MKQSSSNRPALPRGRRDRGQATPLMAILVVIAAGTALVLGQLGAAAVDRAQAQTAADAAALAAAVEGASAAGPVVVANGAVLEGISVERGEATVRVRVGRATASARARAEWAER